MPHIYIYLISQISILYTYIALFIYKNYKKVTFLFLIMLYL